MPLPPAADRRHQLPDGRTAELTTARAVPSPDHLTGPLRDAARDREARGHGVRRSPRRRSRPAGRPREVHAEDERAAARAMGAGKAIAANRSYAHDAELADQAERLTAAAGAVVAAVRDLEAVAPEAWAKNADRIAGKVAEHVGAAEDALATARDVAEGGGRHRRRPGVDATARHGGTGPACRAGDGRPGPCAGTGCGRARRRGAAPDPNLVAAPAHAGHDLRMARGDLAL